MLAYDYTELMRNPMANYAKSPKKYLYEWYDCQSLMFMILSISYKTNILQIFEANIYVYVRMYPYNLYVCIDMYC